jgi:acyl-coenzyme A synthetase/AMP-(fatty) acid ligase
LASYKKPTRVVFGPELPRNLSGKVIRREVRQYFTAEPIRSEAR